MALTPEIRNSGTKVYSIFTANASNVDLSASRVFAIYNFPAEFIQTTGVRLLSPVFKSTVMDTSSLRVFAIVKGRPDTRNLRCWTFSLDGHDFYVLRLGDQETLVYDVTTGQWSNWNTFGKSFWRAHCGFNWINLGTWETNAGLASNVVAGDDTFGRLWVLNPDVGYDEHPVPDQDNVPFLRKALGGVSMRMREHQKVGAAYVTGSFASPQLTGASIQLRTSDDFGGTWQDHGTITVEPGNYDQEFVWRSIGLIKAPGRMFEISDNGATVRIDGLDIR